MAIPKICVMGDSQTAKSTGSGRELINSVARLLRYQLDARMTDLAVPSTTLQDALGFWNALGADDKAAFDHVFIAGFYNNLSANESTGLSNYMTALQTLISQVREDNTSCKIFVSTLVPVKSHMEDTFSPEDAAARYSVWLAVNEALKGNGPIPVEGAVACATEHTDYLNDGDDSMQSKYWIGSDKLHPNQAGKDVIADSWRKVLLPFLS